mmetsp:Transcript_2277/g.4694  ORF Transcript_2277/g.4694 Transcript_2277/m.4694 type:complete len:99 (+) Transcript_2277:65-361(+)
MVTLNSPATAHTMSIASLGRDRRCRVAAMEQASAIDLEAEAPTGRSPLLGRCWGATAVQRPMCPVVVMEQTAFEAQPMSSTRLCSLRAAMRLAEASAE